MIFSSTENRLSGNSSCNHFFGTYSLEAQNKLTISQIGATKMACQEMIIEQQLFQVLPLTKSFIIENNKLTLKNENEGTLARFELRSR